jgi:hypothetical protein
MSKLTHCNFTTEHSLGKGEVDSSILSGSTIKPHEIRASCARSPSRYSATRDATKREHDISTRGKSVESVRGMFR